MTIEDIFLAAVETAPAERAAYLDAACGHDAGLRASVEALLRAHEEAGSLLEQPLFRPAPTVDLPPAEQPGGVIGPYKLLEQIGEGGFGVVFMAEQTQPVRRKVALKVLKPGMDTRQVVARFEAERQALAIMDHPNIARVFDGGATPSGRPYFVMELVKGVPITDFCDLNHLTPRQRLELFVSVCQAVQHAHQKGIIHRDIKPSNVLVTVHDTAPVVKVIDFGVAKALGQELTDKTLFTAFAQMIGTPLYMSPEQAGQSGLDVDTRSDIYSLGVLLYELLTGTTPFDKDRFKKVAYDEIRRIIREEEPPKPSTRLSELSGGAAPRADAGTRGAAPASSLASVAALRHTEPARLTRLVRGELDWIVMKSLEKDRNRRYETATGFAADVQRYLNDEPVQACPPSAGYRIRKFARRNRRGLVTASVIGVALLVGMGAVAGSLGWVVRDRESARVRTAGEVNQFLQRAEALYAENKLPEAEAEVQKARGVLEAGRGDEELDRRVRQWLTDLDTAAKLEEIRLEFLEDRDRGYADYARVFREYGIDVEALPDEEVTARVAASQIKLDLVLALGNWGGWLRADSRPQDPARWQRLLAIARTVESDPLRLRLVGAVEAKDMQTLRELADGADPARLRTRTLSYLGNSLRTAGDVEKSVAFLRRAQQQHPGDFLINSNLALSLSDLKPPPWDEVIAFQRAALAARPRSARAHNALGIALQKKERLDEAVVEYREAIRLRPGFVYPRYNLGVTLAAQKKLDEASACYRQAIAIDPNHVGAHNGLGNALRDQKKLDEAITAFRKAIELDPSYAGYHYNLGLCYYDQDKLDEAIACYRTAIKLDPQYAIAHNDLGNALRGQKKFDEAIAEFRTALGIDPNSAPAYTGLGNVLDDQGKPDEAIDCYKKALALDRNYVWAHNGLGIALREQKKLDEAVACHRTAIAIDPKFAEGHYGLGLCYFDQKNLNAAVACFRTAIELDQKDPEAPYALGNALLAQNKLDEAIVWFKKAIALDAKHARAHHDLGIALQRQNKLDEAIAEYRTAIRIDPKHAMAHNNLGLALRAQKKPDDAVACYRTAIEIEPKNAMFRRNLAKVLSEQRKLDEAIAEYREAIRLEPDHAKAHNDLGAVLDRKGRVDDAIVEFREAIRLEPDFAMAHYNLGYVLSKKGCLDDAIAAYREAIRWKPDYADAHINLGSVLADTGRNDDAIAALREGIRLKPDEPIARHDLGCVLAEMGRVREAIAACEEAIRLKDDYIPAYGKLAWLLAAGPDPKCWDGKRAVELMSKVEALGGKTALSRRTTGLAHYRAGNWKESLAALEEAMKLTKGGDGYHWFCLAMAHQRLGDNAEARKWYDKAAEWTDKNKPKDELGELRRFRAEAAKLLGVGDAVEVAPYPRQKK